MPTPPPRALSIVLLLGLSACFIEQPGDTAADFGNGDGADGGDGGDGGGDGGSDDPNTHCGTIEADEFWSSEDGQHRVTCDLKVERGTLTIAAGTEVIFDPGKVLVVGDASFGAGLVVEGTQSAPVVFRAESEDADPGTWDGVQIQAQAQDVRLNYLAVRNGGTAKRGGVFINGPKVAIDGLAISGSAGCGLTLEDGGRLAEGSRELVSTGNAEHAACVGVAEAHTLPLEGTELTGNGIDAVLLSGSELTQAVGWSDLGVPYVLEANLTLEGTVAAPAVLTLGAGVTLQMNQGKVIQLAKGGGVAGLVAQGTESKPVVFTAFGSQQPGIWKGINVFEATSSEALSFTHTRVEYAGSGQDGAIVVRGVPVTVDHLSVEQSASAGLVLEDGAIFGAGSTHLSLGQNEIPLVLPAVAVGGLPTEGLALSGNGEDIIKVAGDNALSASATWANHGLDYWIDDDIELDGTVDSPAVLTIEAGNRLQFSGNQGLYVAKGGGAAGLLIQGTEADPVRLGPREAEVRGSWSGISIHEAAISEQCVLVRFDLGYGGGRNTKGNLHLVGASPTIRYATLHNSEAYGLYVKDDAVLPVLEEITYSENVSGPCNVAECAEVETPDTGDTGASGTE